MEKSNLTLFKSLNLIYQNKRRKKICLDKPIFTFTKNNRESYKKNEIREIAQDNLFMLKRLLEQKTSYGNKKFKKDFLNNKKYKENVCSFPSIDFYKQFHLSLSPGPIIQPFRLKRALKDKKNLKVKIGNSNFRPLVRSQFGNSTYSFLDKIYYKDAFSKTLVGSFSKDIRKRYGGSTENVFKKSKLIIESINDSGSGSGSGSGNGSNSRKYRSSSKGESDFTESKKSETN